MIQTIYDGSLSVDNNGKKGYLRGHSIFNKLQFIRQS